MVPTVHYIDVQQLDFSLRLMPVSKCEHAVRSQILYNHIQIFDIIFQILNQQLENNINIINQLGQLHTTPAPQ